MRGILSVAAAIAALAVPAATAASVFPIRAAFVYAWYPENWGSPPATRYNPSLGFYDSADLRVVRRQIAELRYGKVAAGIYSWWGRGTPTDRRFPLHLRASRGTTLKWAVYDEQEGYADPDPAAISADIAWIVTQYGDDPNYLRIGGKPVVFVYGGAGDGCDMAARWVAGNHGHAYLVLDAVWVDTEPILADDPGDGTPAAVASADVDGDGRADVIVAHAAALSVRSATASWSVPLDRPPVSVAAGDLDGDRTAEIVLADAAGTVDVRAGDGTLVTSFASGLAAPHLAVSAGRIVAVSGPDVTVFDRHGAPLSTFRAFDPSFTAGSYVAAAGDTIAVSGSDGVANLVRVVDSSGHDLVAPFQPYEVYGGPVSLALGDLDGDGSPEVTTGAAAAPHVRTFSLLGGRATPRGSFYAFDPATVGQLSLATADRRLVAASPAGAVRVFGTYRDCPVQPDDWHEYAIGLGGEVALGASSFTIAPGFQRSADPQPYLVRDLDRWRRSVRDMLASPARWELVLSYSEWGEGTAVASAAQWATRSGYGSYLDALHRDGR